MKKIKVGYDLIYLTECVINGKIPEKDKIEQMNIDEVFEMSRFHSITVIVAMSLESAGIKLDDKWMQEKNKAVRKIILLNAEREKICNYMEHNGIWYMPLKGAVMEKYYPKPYMRQRSDNDILFNCDYSQQLMQYMKSVGYEIVSAEKGCHDVYYKPPVYNFEFHRKLFYDKNYMDIAMYYDNLKSRLFKDKKTDFLYNFKDEDFYIYMVIHEYKHYSSNGTGLRSLIDRYVYLKNKSDALDFEYIESEFEKLKITVFEKMTRNIAMKLFSGKKEDFSNEERKIVEYYILSGTYGNYGNVVERRLGKIKEKNKIAVKLRYCLKRIFPDMGFYRKYYPMIYRYKILIPFFWVYRILRVVLHKRKCIAAELRYIHDM